MYKFFMSFTQSKSEDKQTNFIFGYPSTKMGPLCISNSGFDFTITNVIKRRLGRHWQATSHHASEGAMRDRSGTSGLLHALHGHRRFAHVFQIRWARPTNPLSSLLSLSLSLSVSVFLEVHFSGENTYSTMGQCSSWSFTCFSKKTPRVHGHSLWLWNNIGLRWKHL